MFAQKLLLPAPSNLSASNSQETLPAKERADVVVPDHPADDMAEIKPMLYGIIKEQAEQKITINEQRALISSLLGAYY